MSDNTGRAAWPADLIADLTELTRVEQYKSFVVTTGVCADMVTGAWLDGCRHV